jgi:Cu/Ag efflux pump CusA
MQSPFSWTVVLSAALAYYITLAFYPLFLHPLARFPGPKSAAISRWNEAYYNVVLYSSLTWAEMYRLLAALVREFDYEVQDAVTEDIELETDDFATGTSAV